MRLVITRPEPSPSSTYRPGPACRRANPPCASGWRASTATCPLYRCEKLLAGQAFSGPAIVAQDDCTTCVLPGFDARVDTYGNRNSPRSALKLTGQGIT
ncbi:hypothetical protein ACL7B0_04165 [Bordetella pertussis]